MAQDLQQIELKLGWMKLRLIVQGLANAPAGVDDVKFSDGDRAGVDGDGVTVRQATSSCP